MDNQIIDLEKEIEQKAKSIMEAREFPKFNPQPTAEGLSLTEQAKDYVGAVATQQAVQDEKTVKDITEKKKEELIHSADAHLKEEKAASKAADVDLQTAEYGVNSGVASYAGIKKPLPQRMQKVLFAILSVIQTVFLIAIGIPTSIINIVADCVDSIVKKLSNITKSAKVLVLGLLIVGAVVGGSFLIVSILKNFNII